MCYYLLYQRKLRLQLIKYMCIGLVNKIHSTVLQHIVLLSLLFKNYKFAAKSMPLRIAPTHKTLTGSTSTLHVIYL